MAGNGHNGANGKNGHHAGVVVPRDLPPLDAAAAFRGRRILFTGATGFLGKVTLSMLLHEYPDVGRVYVLVRPGTGGTAEARFFDKVVPSRPFDPVRAAHGAAFDAWMREKCVPVAGDVSDPLMGLSEQDVAALKGVDVVVNCAGLVDFNPSLELAINVNVRGALHGVELCKQTGAALVHVSTCFVAGNRDGVVYEDEEIKGYFPRKEGVAGRPKEGTLDARDFDLDGELADCEKRMARIREEAEDRAQQSAFRERAIARLEAEGRSTGDEKAMKLAVGREKRLWTSQQLVELGMKRAQHWGWPNTYVYTKSLGEQAIARSDVRFAITRPAIVESALRYPFPGWNEGFTTSAPLAFMGLKGQRVFPAADKAILDIVPVDLVAAGIVAATAATIEGRQRKVYHLASGDVNPLWVRRAVDLLGLYRRRYFKTREEGNPTWNMWLARFEPYPVTKRHYETWSAPAFSAMAKLAKKAIDDLGPKWGAPRLSALALEAKEQLDELDSQVLKVKAIWDLFMPFVFENKYVFRCANIRDLYKELSPRDRARIPWDPERIEWREYWLDVHMKGMEEWVFPGLEEESKKKVHAVKQHRDLVELFEAACENHKHRIALRMLGESRKERFTYGELKRFAERVARFLLAAGVKKGDRVLLAAENRPEWGVAYFGILKAGATAVPVDAQLSAAELVNLCKSSDARIALLSEKVDERVPELAGKLREAKAPARIALLAEALAGGPEVDLPRAVDADAVASLIYTSGTTGNPKGVMLTHRNFASLVAKLCGVFDLGPGDGLLSVLPLHHTFEFSCGLLVPLARGAEVSYLDELTSDTLSEAMDTGRITAMIGVPALWSLLHRRITQELAAKPGLVEQAFAQLRKLNARLRDDTPFNLGKLLFWPVHRKMGGRLRLLVSGGSALSPEVQAAFHEMGFNIYEGYGLTEAAPVLTVSSPEERGLRKGSVGKALPGIEIRIHEPDASGVGEVIARGPNVMAGYFGDREATAAVMKEGWLYTGDLGRLDEEGHLYLVGRMKDVIIDANGKNVYPDELEELYAEADLVKELSIVGFPDGQHEKVAMLVVPDYKGRDKAEVRRLVDEHVRRVSAELAFYKRVKLHHFTDADLPRTATRKVKRKQVVELLQKLEAGAKKGKEARSAHASKSGGDGWLYDLVAEVSRKPRGEIGPHTRFAADLAFDSLMLTELSVALEEVGVPLDLVEDLSQLHTVAELALVCSALRAPAVRRAKPASSGVVGAAPSPKKKDAEIPVPSSIAAVGRALLGAGQRALYQKLFETEVVGRAYVPRDRNFLVVANHASHLDMGLVKIALGDQGEKLAALAARDYFFDNAVKRAYFENFTNLIPMDRTGSLRQSLRSATEALKRGYHLLIFPEGTRSPSGELQEFYPTAGYLSLTANVDVLPVYLHGTYDALPKGSVMPKAKDLKVLIGPPLRVRELKEKVGALAKSEQYRVATKAMEDAVRALAEQARKPRAPGRTAVLPPLGEKPAEEREEPKPNMKPEAEV